jgi:signal transduction histidine kinase/CHASE3 domain sensor protein
MKRDPGLMVGEVDRPAPADEPTASIVRAPRARAARFMIRHKLALAFGVQLLLVVAVAVAAYLGLGRVRRSFESAIHRGLQAERLAGEIKSALAAARQAEQKFQSSLLSQGYDRALEHVQQNREHLARLHRTIAELERHEVGETVSYPAKRTVDDLVALKPYVTVYAEDFLSAVALIAQRRQTRPPVEAGFAALVGRLLGQAGDRRGLVAVGGMLIQLRNSEREFLLLGQRPAREGVKLAGDRLRAYLQGLGSADRALTEPLLDRYLEAFERAAELETSITRKVQDYEAAAVVVEPLVADIAAYGQRDAALEVRAARAAADRTVLVMTASLAAAVLAGLGLAWLLGQQITRPVGKLARTAQAIGAGDLTARAEVRSGDEMGMLATTFNQMTAQVRSLVLSLEQRVRERERAEEEVRRLNAELEQRVKARTHELENANHELEAFSYSVSHDLRTPLRHISSFLYLLNQGREDLDDESQGHLKLIGQAVKRMGSLIDALLDFSRLGRTELRRARVPLDLVVREARSELATETEGRDIDWQIAALPAVQGDRTLLRQVFVNLLSNAVKFTRSRSAAQVEVRPAPELAGPGEAVILVRDNGVGFDMAYADKLFGVFKRLHKAEDFDGTGIGLANVHRIVRRHGGRIWAQGSPDAGATFFIALPEEQPLVGGFDPGPAGDGGD